MSLIIVTRKEAVLTEVTWMIDLYNLIKMKSPIALTITGLSRIKLTSASVIMLNLVVEKMKKVMLIKKDRSFLIS